MEKEKKWICPECGQDMRELPRDGKEDCPLCGQGIGLTANAGKKREMEKNLLSVGFYKGDMDFGVNAGVSLLTKEEMALFREMVCVAIGVAEDIWKRNRKEQQGELSRKP